MIKKYAVVKPISKTCLMNSSKKVKKIKKNHSNWNNLTPKSKYLKRKSNLLKNKLTKMRLNFPSSKLKSHKSPTVMKMSKPLAKDSKNLSKNVKKLTDSCLQSRTKNQTKLKPPKMSTRNWTVRPNGWNVNLKWSKILQSITNKWEKKISTQSWPKIPNLSKSVTVFAL